MKLTQEDFNIILDALEAYKKTADIMFAKQIDEAMKAVEAIGTY